MSGIISVIEKIDKHKKEMFMLTDKQKIDIYNEAVKIIKSHKGGIKIYGGYAQNMMIFKQIIIRYLFRVYKKFGVPYFIDSTNETTIVESVKKLLNTMDNKTKANYDFISYIKRNIKYINLSDCFYPIDIDFKTDYAISEPHDIDLYSYKPLEIAEEIFYKCLEMGYKSACIIEAIHHGTYSVRIRNPDGTTFNVCDLTYIPISYFNRIPYDEINGMLMVKDKWVFLDFYKMFSDPVCSSFRFEEVYNNRLKPFEKYFNFAYKPQPLIIENTEIIKPVYDILENFKFTDSIISTGFKAYNNFLSYVGGNRSRNYFNYIKNYCYEFISVNYEEDNKTLQQLFNENNIEFSIIKRQRFCYYKDYTTEYWINNNLVCIIYANNNISIPYLLYREKDNIYKYSCHTFTIYHFIMKMMFDICVLNDKTKQNTYYIIFSHLLEMKDLFLTRYKIGEFDDSPFQFITCETIGKPILNFKTTFYKYSYFSLDESKITDKTHKIISEWSYINISGNIIKAPKSATLSPEIKKESEPEIEKESEL